jgi:hypothetical protein
MIAHRLDILYDNRNTKTGYFGYALEERAYILHRSGYCGQTYHWQPMLVYKINAKWHTMRKTSVGIFKSGKTNLTEVKFVFYFRSEASAQ